MTNNNRTIEEAGNQESTNTDEDRSDDNTYSLYTVGDSSDDEEYLRNAMVHALLAHAVASKAKSDAILAERERFRSTNINETYSITKCVTVLDEIEDVTDDIYMKALEKFMDPSWREVFLAMSSDRRKGWLVRL